MELITVDDEATVGFAFYHIHLSDIQKALDFIEALQTEAIVVVKKSWKGTYDQG